VRGCWTKNFARASIFASPAEYQYLEFARSLSAPSLRITSKIILFGALCRAVLGLRTSIGVALLGAFVGEFVSSEAGLGRYILSAGSLYDVPRVLVGVFLFHF
jgi:NitT/TauT family transport system permease protein